MSLWVAIHRSRALATVIFLTRMAAAIAALAPVVHVVFMGAIGRVVGGDRGRARFSKGVHMEKSTSSVFFQQYREIAEITVYFQQVSE
jgi:hypothetical protein